MAQRPRDLATIWNAYPARKTGQITPLPDNEHTSQDGFTLRRGGWERLGFQEGDHRANWSTRGLLGELLCMTWFSIPVILA